MEVFRLRTPGWLGWGGTSGFSGQTVPDMATLAQWAWEKKELKVDLELGQS